MVAPEAFASGMVSGPAANAWQIGFGSSPSRQRRDSVSEMARLYDICRRAKIGALDMHVADPAVRY